MYVKAYDGRTPHRADVTISIDTEDQPPLVLQVRGRAVVEEVAGIATEYRLSAERYLGAEAAKGLLAQSTPTPSRWHGSPFGPSGWA